MTVAVAMAACAPAPDEAVRPEKFRPTASIQDVMLSFIDPAADVIWESVATLFTPEGTARIQPTTDEDWEVLRREAIRLVEATNLLLVEGREVGRPVSGSEALGIELAPEEMLALIKKDRDAWEGYVGALHKSAVSVLEAVDARDVDRLFKAGATLEPACGACHKHFWYP